MERRDFFFKFLIGFVVFEWVCIGVLPLRNYSSICRQESMQRRIRHRCEIEDFKYCGQTPHILVFKDGMKQRRFCTTGTLNLTCREGKTIRILDGFFSPSSHSSNCASGHNAPASQCEITSSNSTIKSLLVEKCNKKRECTVRVNDALFAGLRNCHRNNSFVYVEYKCTELIGHESPCQMNYQCYVPAGSRVFHRDENACLALCLLIKNSLRQPVFDHWKHNFLVVNSDFRMSYFDGNEHQGAYRNIYSNFEDYENKVYEVFNDLYHAQMATIRTHIHTCDPGTIKGRDQEDSFYSCNTDERFRENAYRESMCKSRTHEDCTMIRENGINGGYCSRTYRCQNLLRCHVVFGISRLCGPICWLYNRLFRDFPREPQKGIPFKYTKYDVHVKPVVISRKSGLPLGYATKNHMVDVSLREAKKMMYRYTTGTWETLDNTNYTVTAISRQCISDRLGPCHRVNESQQISGTLYRRYCRIIQTGLEPVACAVGVRCDLAPYFATKGWFRSEWCHFGRRMFGTYLQWVGSEIDVSHFPINNSATMSVSDGRGGNNRTAYKYGYIGDVRDFYYNFMKEEGYPANSFELSGVFSNCQRFLRSDRKLPSETTLQ